MNSIGNNPGEYPQPLLRTTNVRIPIVGGFITGRMRSETLRAYGTTSSDDATLALVKNQSNAQLTIVFQATNDYANGPWIQIGGTMTIKPQGQMTQTLYPKQVYLGVKGLTGTGEVDIQLSSQNRFEILGFDKGDPNYPTALWEGTYRPWSAL